MPVLSRRCEVRSFTESWQWIFAVRAALAADRARHSPEPPGDLPFGHLGGSC